MPEIKCCIYNCDLVYKKVALVKQRHKHLLEIKTIEWSQGNKKPRFVFEELILSIIAKITTVQETIMGIILELYVTRVLGENAHFPERRLRRKIFIEKDVSALWTRVVDVCVKMEPDDDQEVHHMGFLYTINQATMDLCNWSKTCQMLGKIVEGPLITKDTHTVPAPMERYNYLDLIFAFDNQETNKTYIMEDVMDLLLINAFEEENDFRAPDISYYQLSWRGKIALKEYTFFLFAVDLDRPWWPLFMVMADENNN